MKQVSRREANRINRQNEIIDAALKVFAKDGYSGASMDAIAAEAGLTKPTVYQYFASKDDLFRAMMAAPRDVMMLAFDPAPDKDLVDQLYQFAWLYADTVLRPEFLSLARLIIGETHRFPDVGRAYQEHGPDKVLAGLMAFLDQQRAQGRLRFDDPELAAEDFWGLILSAPRNKALHIPDTRLSRLEIARYLHNGLKVFLKAYATDPERELAKLTTQINSFNSEHNHD